LKRISNEERLCEEARGKVRASYSGHTGKKKENPQEATGTKRKPFMPILVCLSTPPKHRKKTSSQGKSKKFASMEHSFHTKANFLPLFDNYFDFQWKRRRLFPIKTCRKTNRAILLNTTNITP